jgi:hypothetical protein
MERKRSKSRLPKAGLDLEGNEDPLFVRPDRCEERLGISHSLSDYRKCTKHDLTNPTDRSLRQLSNSNFDRYAKLKLWSYFSCQIMKPQQQPSPKSTDLDFSQLYAVFRILGVHKKSFIHPNYKKMGV